MSIIIVSDVGLWLLNAYNHAHQFTVLMKPMAQLLMPPLVQRLTRGGRRKCMGWREGELEGN